MIPGLKWIVAGIVIVVILAFAVVPSGISSGAPNGVMTIYMKDESTGQVFSAELEIGQPTNTMSVFKPVVSFHPLTVYGNQTVAVFDSDCYSFWVSVSFSYSGDKMTSFDSSQATFWASTAPGTGSIIVSQPMHTARQNILTVNYTGALPGPGVTMTIASPITEPFAIVVSQGTGTGPTSWWNKLPLLGSDLNGAKIHIGVSIDGTDINNKAVIGVIDAVLTIMTTPAPNGSISIAIDSMSAGVNPA